MIPRYEDVIGLYNTATATAALTIEAYRDTGFFMEFTRHDQDDVIGYFRFQMSHKKRLGTALELHLHCIPMVNPAADQVVRFEVQYSWQKAGDAFPTVATWTTATADMTVTTTDAFKHKLFELIASVPAPSGESYSSYFCVRVRRLGTSASDTYTTSKASGTAQANLAILGVDCHIVHDRNGSILDHSDA